MLTRGTNSHPNGKSYKQGDVMTIMLICLEIKVLLSHNRTKSGIMVKIIFNPPKIEMI